MISNLILRLQLWLSGVGYDVEVRYNALNNLEMTSAASHNYHHSGCSVSKLYLEEDVGCVQSGDFSHLLICILSKIYQTVILQDNSDKKMYFLPTKNPANVWQQITILKVYSLCVSVSLNNHQSQQIMFRSDSMMVIYLIQGPISRLVQVIILSELGTWLI